MQGKAPLAIPTTFENTKFPSIAEKIKNLVGHKSGRSSSSTQVGMQLHGRQNKVEFCPIQKRTTGMTGLETSEDKLS
jgi:hypothetical protein